jgi:hypothetical protein
VDEHEAREDEDLRALLHAIDPRCREDVDGAKGSYPGTLGGTDRLGSLRSSND